MEITGILCNFRLVLEKADKEIPESKRLEFLEKISGNNFNLSDANNSSAGSLNRGGITDFQGNEKLLLYQHKRVW